MRNVDALGNFKMVYAGIVFSNIGLQIASDIVQLSSAFRIVVYKW